MTNKIVSIDPGDKNIKVIVGKRKGTMLEIEKAIMMSVPEGLLKDGKIEDIHSLKEKVYKLFADNRIREKKVILTLQSTSIITRELVLPCLKPDEMSAMVKYEIEQFLPIVSSEYVIDYSFIEEFEEENVKKFKVRVAAMPRNMVDNYYNLIKEVGLKPVALDIHSNAVSKLFTNQSSVNDDRNIAQKTIALIDIGYQSINVHIMTNSKLNFSRIISLGGKDIDNDVSFDYGVLMEDAERKKIESGSLLYSEEKLPNEEILYDIIRSKVDIWISEIQKIFQYYISRFTGNRIDTIYLYGGSSGIKGLPEYFETALSIKTQKIKQISNVKYGRDLSDMDVGRYINALGGMIRYE